MGQKINNEQFNIPPPKNLPYTEIVLPNVILGDEAFALHKNLMKPYPRQQSLHDQFKATYNYRHSRARRTTENTFGIMASYFRVFFHQLVLLPQQQSIILLLLHVYCTT